MEKLRPNPNDPRNGKRKYWWFKCDCGAIVSRRGDCKASHCSGPLCEYSTFKRHGKSETRLYTIWSGMRDRCINGCHKSAKTYKDKQISIIKEWELFAVFEEWALNNGYSDELTLDRIDITKDYSPDNCEWVTREENVRRQNKDLHGAQKAVRMFAIDKAFMDFPSIRECARHLIAIGIASSTVTKNVATVIGQAIANNTTAYKHTFKFKERDNE